jgi:hypothetical protein
VSIVDELKTGRIGRVPVWAVGVAIAGAILLFMWVRNRRSAPPSTSEDTVEDDSGLIDDVSGLGDPISDYLRSDPTNPAYPVGVTPAGIPGPITNEQWARVAFDLLVSKGDDPALVERALAKYLRGQSLTAAEQAVINEAHRALGAPPEGVILLPEPAPTSTTPIVRSAPISAPVPTKLPTATRRYVYVKRYTTPNPPWESTLSGIAAHYGRTVAQLQQWNGIKNASLIYTGQKIWVDPP